MDIFLLLIPVIFSTLIWPINRYVMQNNGRNEVYGFWISFGGMTTAGLFALLTNQTFTDPAIWWIGLIIAFSFAIGFCLIINYCLKIGPIGPTVTANNMGLVGPVVASFFYPMLRPVSFLAVAGFFFVISALIGFGIGANRNPSQQTISKRWLFLVLWGWAFAASSMTGQYIGSVLVPNQNLSLVSAAFLISSVILFPFVLLKRKNWFKKNEFFGGIANGALQSGSISITLLILQRIDAKIVFPVTVLGPVILMLFTSALIYKEKLNRLTWLACLLGLLGLTLLSLSK